MGWRETEGEEKRRREGQRRGRRESNTDGP